MKIFMELHPSHSTGTIRPTMSIAYEESNKAIQTNIGQINYYYCYYYYDLKAVSPSIGIIGDLG